MMLIIHPFLIATIALGAADIRENLQRDVASDAPEVSIEPIFVDRWVHAVLSSVDKHDPVGIELWGEFYLEISRRVMELQEFGGRVAPAEMQLSPAETRLVELLRRDIQESPFFLDEERSRRERYYEFRALIREGEEAAVQPYREVIAEFQDRFDEMYAREATDARRSAYVLRERAFYLFNYLVRDMVKELGWDPQDPQALPLYQARGRAHARFDREGIYRRGGQLPPEDFQELSPLDRAFYLYLHTAMLHNPMFNDLDQHLSAQAVFMRYRAYVRAGRHEHEQEAYEALIEALRQLNNER